MQKVENTKKRGRPSNINAPILEIWLSRKYDKLSESKVTHVWMIGLRHLATPAFETGSSGTADTSCVCIMWTKTNICIIGHNIFFSFLMIYIYIIYIKYGDYYWGFVMVEGSRNMSEGIWSWWWPSRWCSSPRQPWAGRYTPACTSCRDLEEIWWQSSAPPSHRSLSQLLETLVGDHLLFLEDWWGCRNCHHQVPQIFLRPLACVCFSSPDRVVGWIHPGQGCSSLRPDFQKS